MYVYMYMQWVCKCRYMCTCMYMCVNICVCMYLPVFSRPATPTMLGMKGKTKNPAVAQSMKLEVSAGHTGSLKKSQGRRGPANKARANTQSKSVLLLLLLGP